VTDNSRHLSSGNTQDREAAPSNESVRKKIRSPHDITHQTMQSMVEQWSQARIRTLLALRTSLAELDSEDLFAELAYSTRIAQEATCGRWCAVADLLRAGAVESWTQIGTAMDMTDTEARNGFHAWISGQVAIRQRTGTIGITGAQCAELTNLAQAVAQ
jgi:hypothetical protein